MARQSRIVIRCDPETKGRWQALCANLDAEADYHEVVDQLCDFFEEDESRIRAVERATSGPEFR